MNNINNIPRFKLAEIPVGLKDIPKLIGGEAQDIYVDDFNGDGVPDELHLLREGRNIGFKLMLGEYVEADRNARPGNPLFADLAKRFVKKDVGFIWEAKGAASDQMRITHCVIQDFNKDGLPDIRFAASRALGDGGTEVYAFDLLAQAEPDPADKGTERETRPDKGQQPHLPVEQGDSMGWRKLHWRRDTHGDRVGWRW